MQDILNPFELEVVKKIDKDLLAALKQGGGGVSKNEARYLVDTYYSMQNSRVRENNRLKGLERDAEKTGKPIEPHDALAFVFKQSELLEENVKKILDIYIYLHPMYWFVEQTYGIGSILMAGLLAHIDIAQCPTVGHLYRYCGYDPTVIWWEKEKNEAWLRNFIKEHPEAKEDMDQLIQVSSQHFGRRPATLKKYMTDKEGNYEATVDKLAAALARQPWNKNLKMICTKIGMSFGYFKARDECFYGHLLEQRKAYETLKNDKGDYAAQAEEILRTRRIGRSTAAYAAYTKGKLPPLQIWFRAKRWTTKIFLSHLHECWYKQHFGTEPPRPFAISILHHVDYIPPPQIKV